MTFPNGYIILIVKIFPNGNMEGVNKMLRELRQEKKLTQKEMAHKLGISWSSYKRYENGERTPDVRTAIHIAKAFGKSVEKIWSK